MQFYSFLETSLVTLSLLPHSIISLKDVEIPGTPGTLTTTSLAFSMHESTFYENGNFSFCICLDYFALSTLLCTDKDCFLLVLNLAFASSVVGFSIMHLSLAMKTTSTIDVCMPVSTPFRSLASLYISGIRGGKKLQIGSMILLERRILNRITARLLSRSVVLSLGFSRFQPSSPFVPFASKTFKRREPSQDLLRFSSFWICATFPS